MADNANANTGTDNGGAAAGADDNKIAAGAAAAAAGADKGAGAGDKGAAAAGAAAGDDNKGKGSTITGAAAAGADDNKGVAQPDWPDDWRTKALKDMPEGDEKAKALKRLERFTSPTDIWKALRSVEQAQGQLKKPLPENATPEQLAEFRKDNGIPEKPEGYDTKLDGGLVIGEGDKPLVDDYLKYAHENNKTPAQVKNDLSWFFKSRGMEIQQQMEKDDATWTTTEEALKKEWGAEFTKNQNMIVALASTLPDGAGDLLMEARLPDGTKLGAHPAIVRGLAQWARDIDPAHTVVGSGGSNAMSTISEEITNLERQMGDKSSDYWSKDKGQGLQQRYRDLVTARDKLKKKAA